MRRLSALSLAIGAAFSMAAATPATADFKVEMPDAETGEFAVEPIGDIGQDPLAAHSGELSPVTEFEYGVNSFWRTEIELEQERPPGPGQSIRFSQVTWENVLQFTERGEYWMDSGFFFELGKTTLADTPNEVTFGPILRKEFFHTINTVNLFMQHDVGTAYASGRPQFLYAWETRIALGTPIEPGFQAYGQPSGFPGYNSGWPQDNRIGPQLFGTVLHLGPGDLNWNGGILFGIRPWAPRETWRWQAEYEVHF
ncbi:MAG TPA: hypothetical protein VNV18_01590 [Stellaceae bacterium]|jgi:hypothetical protein|nr:hypothetical protein [Stellaceae bacterium]